MEPKKHIYVAPYDDILGQVLNEIQAALVESRFADKCTNGAPAGWVAPSTLTDRRTGGVAILIHHVLTAAPVATLIDSSIDWRDRYIEGWIAGEDTDNKRLPAGENFISSDTTPTYSGVDFYGYSGLGSAGAPPVVAAGAGQGEQWDLGTWEAQAFGGATWGAGQYIIYADSATGDLYFYNGTGTETYVWGVIESSGDIGGV